jgi:hypothetical protein
MRCLKYIVVLLLVFASSAQGLAEERRWSEQRANTWYEQQLWLVGSNYIPATAINELEMWQTDTFDSQQIDKELGWAESLGMNTMRVFLHDLLWKQDAAGFRQRLDTFLAIAARHHIRPILVLFDSCWDPFPKLGPQHPPIPGVHNSGWVQSPGALALQDPAQYPRLQEYVQGIVGAFANDSRILAWDVWNEPDGINDDSYIALEPHNKVELVAKLLPRVFEWARSAKPSQPLTSAVWDGDWSSPDKLNAIQHIQLEQSDVISFHNYSWPEDFENRVAWLTSYRRPIICTEYMARSAGSTFDTVLPLAKQLHVGAINWGLVVGKTQTDLPWDSWQRPYVLQKPTIWFHEIFHPDGTPYREQEVKIIRTLTGKSASGERGVHGAN